MPSIEGVFFINIYDRDFVKMLKSQNDPNASVQDKKLAQRLDQYKKTLYTFDSGVTWKELAPPVVQMDGKKFKCEYDCSLHLHMFSSDGVPRVYSVASALGLVIGHGNVGPRLSSRIIGVFLSRDGGNT